MSTSPAFYHRGAFPFCVPSWTGTQCDNYQLTGNPDTTLADIGITDPDLWTTGYGRFVDLTLQEAWAYYWMTEAITIALTANTLVLSGTPAFGLPAKRACIAATAVEVAAYSPGGGTPDTVTTFTASVVAIALNTTTGLYEVFWTMEVRQEAPTWDGVGWGTEVSIGAAYPVGINPSAYPAHPPTRQTLHIDDGTTGGRDVVFSQAASPGPAIDLVFTADSTLGFYTP